MALEILKRELASHGARLGACGCVPVDHRGGRARAVDDGSRAARQPRLAVDGSRSLTATVLFVVFLILPWGNAVFLMAIVSLFAWIAAVAVRLATYTS
jgi:hypothetical protein